MGDKKRLLFLGLTALALAVVAIVVFRVFGGPGGSDTAYSSEMSKQVPVAPAGADQGPDPNARILQRGQAPSQASGQGGGSGLD
ncbi:MAG TPA: hypothetical protein PLO61_04515 [Fimbriimonadaceae bacterium]|nr:hypothetical protein [Fimbriimonadaceae bacterium]HRJ32777.1 hypothetical protein [Fimbriimonadaceae bacterium]